MLTAFRDAAEQKNLSAMNDLAFCRLHGIGVEKVAEGGFSSTFENYTTYLKTPWKSAGKYDIILAFFG